MATPTELKLGDELVVTVLSAQTIAANPGVFAKGKRVIVSWGGRLHTATVVDLRQNPGDDKVYIHGRITSLNNGVVTHGTKSE